MQKNLYSSPKQNFFEFCRPTLVSGPSLGSLTAFAYSAASVLARPIFRRGTEECIAEMLGEWPHFSWPGLAHRPWLGASGRSTAGPNTFNTSVHSHRVSLFDLSMTMCFVLRSMLLFSVNLKTLDILSNKIILCKVY